MPEITFPGSGQPQLPPMPIPESPIPSGDVQVERPTGGPSTQGSPDMPGFDGDAQGEEHIEIFHEYQSLKNVFGEEMSGELESGGVLGPVKPYLTEKQPPADDDVPGSRGNDPFRQAVEAEQYLQDRDAGQLPLGDISGSPVGSSGAPDMPDLSGGLGDPGNQGGSGPGGAAGQIGGTLSDAGSAPATPPASLPVHQGETRFGGYEEDFEKWYEDWPERNQGNRAIQEFASGYEGDEVKEYAYGVYNSTMQPEEFMADETQREYAQHVRTCLSSPDRRVDFLRDGTSYAQLNPDGSLYALDAQRFGEQSTSVSERWMSARGEDVYRNWTAEWGAEGDYVTMVAETTTTIRDGINKYHIKSVSNNITLHKSEVDITSPDAVIKAANERLEAEGIQPGLQNPEFEAKKQEIISKYPKTNPWSRK